jgi:hypothetical protein
VLYVALEIVVVANHLSKADLLDELFLNVRHSQGDEKGKDLLMDAVPSL